MKKNLFKAIFLLLIAQLLLPYPLPVLAIEDLAPPIVATTTEARTEIVAPVLEDVKKEESVPVADIVEKTPTAEVIESTSTMPAIITEQNKTSESSIVVEESAKDTEKIDETKPEEQKVSSYAALMRKTSNYRLGVSKNVKKEDLANELKSFIKSEEQRLDSLSINADKKDKYFSLLRRQLVELGGDDSNLARKVLDKVQDMIGIEKKVKEAPQVIEDQVKIPEHPATFGFSSEPVKVKSMNGVRPRFIPEKDKLDKKLKSFFLGEEVKATPDDLLPVLEDVKADGAEVVITSEIQQLAIDLQRNPVKIFNYLKNNISYEPYAGAKKGSVGCLKEKVCNDLDAASLAVALVRASGIPARYKKGVAVVSVAQLKSLLGVDETKTVYAALASNKVSVYLLSGSVITEGLLDQADLTGETHLALEWTYPEIYYEYDQRGANTENTLDFSVANTTPAVHDLLFYSPGFYQTQWLPFEVLIKPYTRSTREIVADSANFNGETFWNGFFSYQGDLAPAAKYQADLRATAGKDPFNANYQSGKTITQKDFQILPAALPYTFGAGEDGQGNVYNMEAWSVLPNTRRPRVKITLKKSNDNQVVLEHTFYASEINNAPLELSYEGATDADKAVIESYGGIAATPAALVDIKPYILGPAARYEAMQAVNIGDSLIMQFDYTYSDLFAHTDEKFSTAGNDEGIYISLSELAPDNYLDDASNPNRNSLILLNGNAAIAREYLKRNEDNGKLLKQSLDYQYGTVFSRAVVTQNRILSVVNGTPTTFDFGGLTVDAGTYITDWSNRGNYKNHRREFRLLWGLQASYDEGQMFKDVAGLDGISTAKGLQYAKGLPAEYTVHTITTANENVIDTLNLSANTKANMHTEVQAGNKIITPNKTVTKGAFRGILYIVLKPDWTGTYAIGEQVANGGWTTDGFEILIVNVGGREVGRFVNEGNNEKFIFADSNSQTGVNKICRIKSATFLEVINDDNWQEGYGLPCFKEEPTKKYHQFVHGYTLATDAIKFESQEWDYWIEESKVSQILERDKNKDNIEGITNIKLNGTFKFNTHARTYSRYGTYGGPYENEQNKNSLTAYFSPRQGDGDGYVVYGLMLEKLASEYNGELVLDIIGFPMNNRKIASQSAAKTDGKYQDFIGGQIYIRNGVSQKFTYFVPKAIEDLYEEQECYDYGEEHRCGLGTYGPSGFPIEDPSTFSDSWIQQVFENRSIFFNPVAGSGGKVMLSEKTRRTRNKDFAKKMSEETKSGQMTDVEAFAEIADYAASLTDDTDQFVRDLTMLFVGVEKVGAINTMRTAYYIDNLSEYQLDRDTFSDTGFKFEYNDSHYGQNSGGISNQLYHSMGGFSLGYFYMGVNVGNFLHEQLQKFRWQESPFGTGGSSKEDSNLTLAMGDLADELEDGDITKDQVGEQIMQRCAETNLDGMAKTREELKNFRDIRWNFRTYEKTKIDDERWFSVPLLYTEDIKQEGDDWVQHYEKFNDYENAKSVWVVDENVLEFYDKDGNLVDSFIPIR